MIICGIYDSRGYPNEMEDEYSYEQVLEFHYMYYDFAIFRLEKLEEE